MKRAFVVISTILMLALTGCGKTQCRPTQINMTTEYFDEYLGYPVWEKASATYVYFSDGYQITFEWSDSEDWDEGIEIEEYEYPTETHNDRTNVSVDINDEEYEYKYDNKGRVVEIKEKRDSGGEYLCTYEYNDEGYLQAMSEWWYEGECVKDEYAYNEDGNLIRVVRYGEDCDSPFDMVFDIEYEEYETKDGEKAPYNSISDLIAVLDEMW